MLNEGEKIFACEILELVEERDLYSLVSTITNNMEYATNRQEAVEIIVNCTEDLTSLLSRKKLHKEVIFKYMLMKRQNVVATMDKITLITRLLTFWKNLTENGLKSSSSELHTPSTAPPETTELDVAKLAEQFTQWFYELYNQTSDDKKESGLETRHFFQDCSLKLEMVSPTGNVERLVDNDAEEVVQVLNSARSEYQLFYNPNLSSKGVKGMQNVHGAVAVYACGTLHRLNSCCGIFEQMFILIRDPFSLNNWKIKKTELKIKSQEVQSLPVLDNSVLSLPTVVR